MLKKWQWITVGLLFSGSLINYMDRAVFGVLAPLTSKELALDPAQMGWVLSAFSIGYVAFCFLGGWATDRFGARATLSVSMTIWSIACAMIGFVSSLPALLGLRAVFGAGESPWLPASNKVMMRWFSKEQYPRAYGIMTSGGPLGGVVAGPLVGIVAAFFGWRAAFLVVGGIGIAWVLVWLLLASNTPEESPNLDDEARAEMARSRIAETAHVEPGEATSTFRKSTLIATSFAFFCFSYMLFFFISWFPTYLTMQLKLTTEVMGVVSAIPWLLGVAGTISGGFICSWAIRRSGDALKGSKMVLVAGLVLTGLCVALCGVTTSTVPAVILMAGGVGFLYLTGTTYYVLALEGISETKHARVASVLVTINVIGGIIAPVITGYIVKATGSFTGAFVLAASVVIVGAIVVTIFVRNPNSQKTTLGHTAPQGAT